MTEVAPAEGLPEPRGTYSQAVRVPAGRDLLFVSGLSSRDHSGAVVAPGDAAGQAAQVFANLRLLLEQNGGSLADVVRTTYYLVDFADRPAVEAARRHAFAGRRPPASTMVQVAALVDPSLRLEVEVVAALG